MLDCDTAITCNACICEEIFGAKTEVYEKKEAHGAKASLWGFRKHENPTAPLAELDDMPLFLKVISLCDGRPLKRIFRMLVKYSNVSSIMWIEAEPDDQK